jgi:hypothetical protein
MSATYTPLATTTLGTAVSSITFGSIPGTYRDLILVIQANTSAVNTVRLRFNGDTGGNYNQISLSSNPIAHGISSIEIGMIQAQTTTGYMGIANIMDYSATDKEKVLIARADSAATATLMNAGRWGNTAAITSILVTTGGANTFSIGTTMALYGIIS